MSASWSTYLVGRPARYHNLSWVLCLDSPLHHERKGRLRVLIKGYILSIARIEFLLIKRQVTFTVFFCLVQLFDITPVMETGVPNRYHGVSAFGIHATMHQRSPIGQHSRNFTQTRTDSSKVSSILPANMGI